MKVESDRLKKVLGLSRVSFSDVNHPIAITDVTLNDETTSHDVTVDNFHFDPATRRVPVGATVTWTNRDDVPHVIASTKGRFKSPALDTDERYSHRFEEPGPYPYFCSLHPKMTGEIVVAS